MLFNSIDFALFLPIVFVTYWLLAKLNIKWQNLLIVIASYTFYGWWDWRFLSLIIFSTVVDYFVGRALANENVLRKRKFLLWTSIIINLGFLGFFKYYNFFLENFVDAFTFLGMPIKTDLLHIILPVGISFYTFQTLSYTIDVYRRKLEPTKDFVAFAAFVSFFPQLVAGPIERATNLLPQFYTKRNFDYSKATNGMRQMLWGLFKKVVIADNCAHYVNIIFNNPENYQGSMLFLGATLFAFQIYCDFSGYSDIAIGTARLFGFDLKRNFAFPYFSRDIAEFWRRWHISLSTWFRDYLYIPLGGSRGSVVKQIRNVFIIFIVSGFWHGANWTFIVWGGLNALYFIPLLLLKRNRNNLGIIAEDSFWPRIRDLMGMLLTFGLTVLAWVFFRAETIADAFIYLSGIFSNSLFTVPEIGIFKGLQMLLYLLLFFNIIEWFGRKGEFAFEAIENRPKLIRWSSYIFVVFLIGMYMQTKETPFIYFQF